MFVFPLLCAVMGMEKLALISSVPHSLEEKANWIGEAMK